MPVGLYFVRAHEICTDLFHNGLVNHSERFPEDTEVTEYLKLVDKEHASYVEIP